MALLSPPNTFFKDYKIDFSRVVKESLGRVYYSGQSRHTQMPVLCCKIFMNLSQTGFSQRKQAAVANEMKIVSLNSEYILPLYKVYHFHESYYFIYAMPSCLKLRHYFNDSKSELMPGVHPSPHKLARFILHCIQALVSLHSQQIIHGNINPHNIVMGTNGLPQLVNFADGSQIPDAHSTLDHPLPVPNADLHQFFTCDNCHFFAPEMCANNLHYTKTVDVYSLGHTILCIALRKYTFHNTLTCVSKQMNIYKLYKKFCWSRHRRKHKIMELEYDKYFVGTQYNSSTQQVYKILNNYPPCIKRFIEDCFETQKNRKTSQQLLDAYKPLLIQVIK